MNTVLKIVSYVALALTLVPAILFATGHLTQDAMKTCLLVGAVLWFGTAPFWMKSE